MNARRFSPPWSIEERSACFIVRDGNKQALAYLYFENEPGRRSSAKLLTRDEAFLIAVNIAKLPSVPRQILKDIPRAPNTGEPGRLTEASFCHFRPSLSFGVELRAGEGAEHGRLPVYESRPVVANPVRGRARGAHGRLGSGSFKVMRIA